MPRTVREALDKTKALTVPDATAPTVIDGPWEVTFPGIAAPTSFAKLASWTEHADPAIKYFSGTATFRNLSPSANFRQPWSESSSSHHHTWRGMSWRKMRVQVQSA